MQPSKGSSIDLGERTPRYAIVMTQQDDGYELRVLELLLVIKAPTLREAYERLRTREHEIVELARRLGAFHELPAPAMPKLQCLVGL